jgi:class 3 adenylate cyclase
VALVARVKAALRLKQLHDQISEMNKNLEQRVTEQLGEIERMSGLKRFLAPQIAELVLSSGGEKLLESHRKDVTIVFCDLRGFTSFAETAEPEEVMTVLREYHDGLAGIINAHEGTLERFAGDGLMVLFNDPMSCPDPCERGVKMAVQMRERVFELAAKWKKLGHDLGFGVGIAHGYATLGRVSQEGRFDYTAIGRVVNLAARLCGEAKSGQILIDGRVHTAVETMIEMEPAGDLTLKGFQRPIAAFDVRGLRAT